MYWTQEEMLVALEESRRTGWTLRQMTALRGEGFLPPLTRQPGTTRNVWSKKDLDQLVAVYDCWEECAGNRVALTLLLWLQGYKVPLDRLREFYERTSNEYLQRLTHGETEQEAILDEISGTMLAFFEKLKYMPGFAAQRKKADNMEQVGGVMEALLDALAVDDPERATEILYSFLSNADGAIEKMAKGEAFFEEELGERPQHVAAILHDTLTLTHLHEAIQTATREQWDQARDDYLRFCQLCNMFGGILATYGPPVPALPEWFITRWKTLGALWLIAPFLSARYWGYGQEFDTVFKKIYEFLTDTEANEMLATLASKGKLFPALPTDQEEGEAIVQ